MSASCAIFGMPAQCNNAKSGVKIGYWISKDEIAGFQVDASGNVTSLTLQASKTFTTLNFEKEDAQFKSDMGGTVMSRMWAQTLAFTYKKMQILARHFIQSAAAANGVVFVLRDWNDNFIVMGLDNGAMLDADATDGGKEFGTMNGAALVFKANEPYKEYYMTSTVFGTLTVGN